MWLGPKGAMWKKNGSKVRATTSRAVRGTQREKHTHSELSNALFLPGASRANHTRTLVAVSASALTTTRVRMADLCGQRERGAKVSSFCALCCCCTVLAAMHHHAHCDETSPPLALPHGGPASARTTLIGKSSMRLMHSAASHRCCVRAENAPRRWSLRAVCILAKVKRSDSGATDTPVNAPLKDA